MTLQRIAHPSSRQDKNGFRYRGLEVSRLEAFSDVVFGFALTLLVISLEVPKTYEELRWAMRDFPAFAICFCLLVFVWYGHGVYFRRYGLQDGKTIFLNSVLLFTVLFYMYPLKFLFTFLVKALTGGELTTTTAAGRVVPILELGNVRGLMVIYGVGFAAIFGVFAWMYAHALSQAESLELNDLERFETREGISEHLAMVAVALASIILALALPLRLVGISGWLYAVIGPMQTILGMQRDKKRKRLLASAAIAASR